MSLYMYVCLYTSSQITLGSLISKIVKHAVKPARSQRMPRKRLVNWRKPTPWNVLMKVAVMLQRKLIRLIYIWAFIPLYLSLVITGDTCSPINWYKHSSFCHSIISLGASRIFLEHAKARVCLSVNHSFKHIFLYAPVYLCYL